jgi:hypothetical protein
MWDYKIEYNYSGATAPPCPCESGLDHDKCCGVVGGSAVKADLTASINSQGVVDNDKLTPQIVTAIENIGVTPDLFPARFDFARKQVLLVKMSPRWYRKSTFLEPNRVSGHSALSADLEWLNKTATAINWQPTSFIFHTAFCGSTLMTQALDSMFNCLALREPQALNQLLVYRRSTAPSHRDFDYVNDAAYSTALRLLSRRYNPGQGVVAKANDHANAMMLELIRWRSNIPMLFMYTPVSQFLVGCLRAPNRREWIFDRYKLMRPLAEKLLGFGDELVIKDDDYGEMSALYWSYNIALYYQAREHSNAQLHSLDFNVMLSDAKKSVEACAKVFALNALENVNPDQELERLFGVYSKDTNFKYSPQQRESSIEKTLNDNQAHLDAAEALAKKLLGERYPYEHLPGAII